MCKQVFSAISTRPARACRSLARHPALCKREMNLSVLDFSCNRINSCIQSLIHSGYLYSASSSPPLLRGAPDTAGLLCPSFTPKRNSQLRGKDLSKVPTWRLERASIPRPFGRKATNQPMSHHAPQIRFNSFHLLHYDKKDRTPAETNATGVLVTSC